MKLNGLHWDPSSRGRWIKKVHKEEFLTAFQKNYVRAKACIYASGGYFE
jgi:hypothetical protein